MRYLTGLACAIFLWLTAAAPAQEALFPRKGTIEITVLFPAGSSADVTARMLADGMSRHLGANIIVVNRPGAGGAIAAQQVAGMAPDGLNLLVGGGSESISLPAFRDLPYDPKKPLPKLGSHVADLNRLLEENQRRQRRERLTLIRCLGGAARARLCGRLRCSATLRQRARDAQVAEAYMYRSRSHRVQPISSIGAMRSSCLPARPQS